MPTRDQLREALLAAGRAHHGFAQGARADTPWSGFCAADALGQLGCVSSPTDWAGQTATCVLAMVSRS